MLETVVEKAAPTYLYDHLVRLPGDAPNRLDDLRAGPVGALGAIGTKTRLFARPGSDLLVSNVGGSAYRSPGFSIRWVGCYIGLEPRSGSYAEIREYIERLTASMRWTLEWNDGARPLHPHYTANLPHAVKKNFSGVIPRPGPRIATGQGCAVVCEIPSGPLLDALNAGQVGATQFDTRVIRFSMQVEQL